MNKAVPWSVKGVGFDAREAAKEAARRAGLSLGEWLNAVIAEQASALGVEPEEIDAEDRLDAVAQKLAKLSRREGAGLRTPEEPVARRSRRDETDRTDYGRRNLRDPDLMIEQAVEAIERRARAIEDKTATALADVAHHLDATETKRGAALAEVAGRLSRIERRQSGRDAAQGALEEITDRLAELEHRVTRRPSPPAPPEPALTSNAVETGLKELDRKIAALNARMSEPARPREPTPPPTPPTPPASVASPLESKLDALIDALAKNAAVASAPAAPSPPHAVPPPKIELSAPFAKHSVSDAIAEISRRQRELDARQPMRANPRESVSPRALAMAEPRLAAPQAAPLRYERLESLAARLERAAERADVAAAAEHGAVTGLKGDIATLASRLDELHRDFGAPRPAAQAHPEIDLLRREIAGLSGALGSLAPRTSVAALEGAVRDLSRRIEASRDGGMRESLLEPVAHLAADVRGALAEIDPRRSLGELDRAVRSIGSKIESLGAQTVAPEIIDAIYEQTHEIRRLVSEALARPMPLEKIEAQIAALTQRIGALPPQPGSRAGAQDMTNAVEEIRAMLDRPNRGSALQALEERIETLSAKIDEAVATGGDAAPFAELSNRLDRYHSSIAARLAQPSVASVDPRGLDEALRALIDKLEVARGVPTPETEAVAALNKQMARIAERLDAPRPAALDTGALSGLQDEIARLAARLERTERSPSPDVTRLERIVAQLADTIAAGPAAPSPAIAALQDQVERVAGRLEEVRARPPMLDTSGLEMMIASLAERIEAVRAPTADAHAFDELHTQIAALAARMDATAPGAAGIAALQNSIEDLFGQIETTRHAAIDAAETAARSAARETLREVMLNPPPGAAHPVEHGRELAQMRDMQDAADRRTHSTLAAVHDTLKSMVDRMAQLEGEMREARPAEADAFDDAMVAAMVAPSPKRSYKERQSMAHPAFDVSLAGQKLDPTRGVVAAAAKAPDNPPPPDYLIEPGTGFTPNRRAGDPVTERRDAAGGQINAQASFIAAARRAMAAAQSEAAGAFGAHATGREDAQADSAPDSAGGKTRMSLLAARKKPILIGIAALVMMAAILGVMQMTRKAPDLARQQAEQPEPAAPSEPTPKPAAALEPRDEPVPKTASVDLDPTPQTKAAPNVDTTSTASIASPVSGLQAGAKLDAKQAALGGAAVAQYELASRFAEGRLETRDLGAAAKWFEKAATQGLAPAQYRLGSLYEKGLGVPRDQTLAKLWYQRAAERGNARAMHNLAVLLADAGGGRPDYVLAANWFRKAAELGVRDSQYNLAILYARGLGVDQDLAQSYLWFSVAAAQGDEDAGKKRNDVAARLGEKLADAQTRVAAFKPQTPDPAANIASWPSSPTPNVLSPARVKPKMSSL